MSSFAPLLALLSEVPDPRRGQGQKYELEYVLLFSILAVVTGCNSYRGIATFIDVHRRRLNAAFGLGWKRAPAYTAIRYILKGLDPRPVETVFRRHAARLQASCGTPGRGSIALDGKVLRGSFDNFNDRAAAQVLSAFATETSLVLAHVDIAEKSNEIPAAQALLAELGVEQGVIVTLDAIHCQKNSSRSQRMPTSLRSSSSNRTSPPCSRAPGGSPLMPSPAASISPATRAATATKPASSASMSRPT